MTWVATFSVEGQVLEGECVNGHGGNANNKYNNIYYYYYDYYY